METRKTIYKILKNVIINFLFIFEVFSKFVKRKKIHGLTFSQKIKISLLKKSNKLDFSSLFEKTIKEN